MNDSRPELGLKLVGFRDAHIEIVSGDLPIDADESPMAWLAYVLGEVLYPDQVETLADLLSIRGNGSVGPGEQDALS